MFSQYWVAYPATMGDRLGQGYHELQVLSARKWSALFSHRNGSESSLHFSCPFMDLCTIQKHDINSIQRIDALWKGMTSVLFHGSMHNAKAWHQFHSMHICTMQKHDISSIPWMYALCKSMTLIYALCNYFFYTSSIPGIYALCKSMTSVPFQGSMYYAKAWH